MNSVRHTGFGPGASRWLIVALLSGFSMISYLDRTIISIAGSRIISEFGVSPAAMGAVYSAFTLGYGLFMIPGGHFTDRFGAWRTLTIVGAGSAFFTGVTALGGSAGLGAVIGIVPFLFIIRLGLGIATAPLYPACARMTANWIPIAYHGRVQGLIIAGSSFGAAITPLLFTQMAIYFPWRFSFLIAAFATVALGFFWLWYARDYPASGHAVRPVQASKLARSWRTLFRNRNLLLITYAYGALGYFQYIFFYWMYYYFENVLHLSKGVSARYTTVLFLTEGLIMPIGGLLSDRLTNLYGPQLGRRIVPIAGLSLGALLLYLATGTSGFAAVVCFSLACGLAACCEGPFWATITDMSPEQVGGASSILNTGAQIGGFFAPVLTPLIAARSGWHWALYAGCLLAISGVIAVYNVRLPEPRNLEEAQERQTPFTSAV
jgi:MFS transporter, ACS family, D-galactonate transporter